MKYKNIFIIFSTFSLGGIQRKIVDLANYVLTDKEYKKINFHIIIKNKRVGSQFCFDSQLKKHKRIHLHYYPIQMRFVKRLFYLTYLTLMYLRYKPISVLTFLHYSLFNLVILKFIFRNTKLVLGQDNILKFENSRPYTNRPYPRFLIRYLYNKADLILTQTFFAKKDMVNSFRVESKKIKVKQNWVVNSSNRKVSKKYDLIYCGRIEPQKQIEKMIKLVILIKKNNPKIKLALFGEGSDKDRIIRLIGKHKLENNIFIFPTTSNIEVELARSKFFILTSKFEGHPMILLEAMDQGIVPVVLSYPGSDEYIINGETGFIENNINSMSQRITLLLNNSKKLVVIGKKARSYVRKNNSEDLLKSFLSQLIW
jgi:glycosyltransferase involved in cell wall biosynthesis